MNFKWLLFNLPLQNVWYFAGKRWGRAASLCVEGERQRLIWNSLYHLPHAKISAIQQVIRNAKKTRGKWEYLGVKVTLGPPSVGAYALCVHLSAWQISLNAAVLLFFDFFIPSPTSTAALCSTLIHLQSDHITSFCSGFCLFFPFIYYTCFAHLIYFIFLSAVCPSVFSPTNRQQLLQKSNYDNFTFHIWT